MKKILLVLVVSLLLGFTFCSKDDDDDKSGNQGTASPQVITQESGEELLKFYSGNLLSMLPLLQGFGLGGQNVENLSKANDTTFIFPVDDTTYIEITLKDNPTKLDIAIKMYTPGDSLDAEFTIGFYDQNNNIIPLNINTSEAGLMELMMLDLDSLGFSKIEFEYDIDSRGIDTVLGRVQYISEGDLTIENISETQMKINGTCSDQIVSDTMSIAMSMEFNDLLVDDEEEYPTSGSIKFIGAENSFMMITFNGTALADVEIYDGSSSYYYTLNLETGELIRITSS